MSFNLNFLRETHHDPSISEPIFESRTHPPVRASSWGGMILEKKPGQHGPRSFVYDLSCAGSSRMSNSTHPKMQMLIEFDDPAEEHLIRRQAVGNGRLQTHVVAKHSPAFSRLIIFRFFACGLSCVMRMEPVD